MPITEAHIPNLNIQVDVAGSAPRVDDKGESIAGVPNRPAYATGSLNLKIPPLQRQLNLTAVPAQPELEPGKETSIQVTLKDSQGNPVNNAEVAVIVVDEAILALTNYSLADPVSLFYSNRPSGFTNSTVVPASFWLIRWHWHKMPAARRKPKAKHCPCLPALQWPRWPCQRLLP